MLHTMMRRVFSALPHRSQTDRRPTATARGARPGSAPLRTGRAVVVALAVVLLAALSAATAQDLGVEAILDNVEARAEATEDVSFLLTGALYDPDGTEIALEIDALAIPAAGVASAYIIQPDALADNVIVLDGDAVYNYVYLTNQVTIFDVDDPDALGGLIGEREVEAEEFEVTFDVRELLAAYEPVGSEYVDTPVGPAYRITFVNDQPDANFSTVVAEVIDGEWYPYTLELIQPGGTPLARLVFQDVAFDTGLVAADVTYLPEDAEVFDERE